MFRLINKLKNRKGFTLIELIVVLAVLAIIMAIAVPRFMGVREEAKKDSDAATIASIAKLAELEYVRKNMTGTATGYDIKDLVDKNFPEYPEDLFQSITLDDDDVIKVDYDANGKVTKVTIDPMLIHIVLRLINGKIV